MQSKECRGGDISGKFNGSKQSHLANMHSLSRYKDN